MIDASIARWYSFVNEAATNSEGMMSESKPQLPGLTAAKRPTAAEPKEPRAQVIIRLEQAALDRIDRAARETGLTRSGFIVSTVLARLKADQV